MAESTYQVREIFTLKGGDEMVISYAVMSEPAVGPLFVGLANQINDSAGELFANTSGASVGIRGVRNLLSIAVTHSERIVREAVRRDRIPPWRYAGIGQMDTAGECLPYELAAVATLHTTKGGKSGRGRIYFGGFPVSANVGPSIGGQISDTVRNGIGNALQDLNTRLRAQTTPCRLAVWSRTLDQGNPVRMVSVDTLWDVQRRRGDIDRNSKLDLTLPIP